ncbi:hypothetical protein GJAV_G00236500 [Gymnothorax javanicus]|nr:hypothetical protein GJAV_G00236500 [Gymnothorax javanicus]
MMMSDFLLLVMLGLLAQESTAGIVVISLQQLRLFSRETLSLSAVQSVRVFTAVLIASTISAGICRNLVRLLNS